MKNEPTEQQIQQAAADEALADQLEERICRRELAAEDIGRNINSEPWWRGYRVLSRRLRDAERLQALVAGLLVSDQSRVTVSQVPLAIGLGGAGTCAIVRLLKESRLAHDACIAVNREIGFYDCRLPALPRKVVMSVTGKRGLCDPGRDFHRLVACAAIPRMAAAFRGAERAVLMLSANGSVGPGIAPVVACVLRLLGVDTRAVVARPFKMETRGRPQRVEGALAAAAPFVSRMQVVDPDAERDRAANSRAPGWRETVTVLEAMDLLLEVMVDHACQQLCEAPAPPPGEPGLITRQALPRV